LLLDVIRQLSKYGEIMRRYLLPLTGIALALSLSACGSSSSEPAASQATSEAISAPVVTETVPWSDYSPALKNDLDALASAMNCQELQSQFELQIKTIKRPWIAQATTMLT
jgi:hypothetical protein